MLVVVKLHIVHSRSYSQPLPWCACAKGILLSVIGMCMCLSFIHLLIMYVWNSDFSKEHLNFIVLDFQVGQALFSSYDYLFTPNSVVALSEFPRKQICSQ